MRKKQVLNYFVIFSISYTSKNVLIRLKHAELVKHAKLVTLKIPF